MEHLLTKRKTVIIIIIITLNSNFFKEAAYATRNFSAKLRISYRRDESSFEVSLWHNQKYRSLSAQIEDQLSIQTNVNQKWRCLVDRSVHTSAPEVSRMCDWLSTYWNIATTPFFAVFSALTNSISSVIAHSLP